MDNSKKYLSIAFVVILVVVVSVSALGIWMLGRKPVILQGQIEATEIRISGKLPGRIDTFWSKRGKTCGRAIRWWLSTVPRRWPNTNR